MWLQQYFLQDKHSKEYTHLLLNGGKLKVNDADHGTFLNQYAQAVCRKESLFIVESKTPVFRLFVDFDFQPPQEEGIMTAAIQTLVKIASGYYFDVSSHATILRKDKETPAKVGIHLVWDSIYVTPLIAKAFRHHVVDKLHSECPEVPWTDIVDASVYGGSGLRMPWSHKVNSEGVYIPIKTVHPDGTVECITQQQTFSWIREWVHKTSIRSPAATPTKTCIEVSVPEECQKPGIHHLVSENIQKYTKVLQQVQDLLPSVYEDQQFTSMQRYSDTCIILRSTSRLCGNKKHMPHKSSTVYFVLLKKGYGYQRCFSRKDTVHEGGGVTCIDYTGDPFRLPERVVEGFWPSNDKKERRQKGLELLLNKTRASSTKKKPTKRK